MYLEKQKSDIPLSRKWRIPSSSLAGSYAITSKGMISMCIPINPCERFYINLTSISGCLVNWAVELSQFNINYLPRTLIKGQALSDFLVECTAVSPSECSSMPTIQIEAEYFKAEGNAPPWVLYVDSSSTTNCSGVGILLVSHEGFEIKQSIQF